MHRIFPSAFAHPCRRSLADSRHRPSTSSTVNYISGEWVLAGASAFHFFDIVGLRTAQFPERLQERRVAELVFCIVCSARHKQADAPHAVTLPRAHRESTRGRVGQ